MKKLINIGLLTALFYSCDSGEEKSVVFPSNVLSEAQFVKVLADFALAEGAANMNIKNAPVQTLDSVYAFNPLIQNNVRKSQYDSTLRFYTEHPDLYKKVYENVLVRLTEMQSRKDVKADSNLK